MKAPAPLLGHAWPAWSGIALAWSTLLLALFLTFVTWNLARHSAIAEAQLRFAAQAAEIRLAVQARMQAQAQVLRASAALFNASENVSREEWRAYVSSLRLEDNYPGLQGLAFAVRLRPSEVAAHVRAVRAEGFPDYQVQPPGPRPEYTAIVYIEPFDERNRRAFGYDMFSEPLRRTAMERARDTGEASITGKVTLVQEGGTGKQAGFLMYLPVYGTGLPRDNVADRRAALRGYVYSPFRMNDLMDGILGHQSSAELRLRIHDGGELGAASRMYDSVPDNGRPPGAERFVADSAIDFGGRRWTLHLSSLPQFEAGIRQDRSQTVLVAGMLISLLLFAVVWSLATLRERALAIATRMTAALRESREQIRAITETAHDAIVSTDGEGRIAYFNHAAERIFGYPRAAALGQPLGKFLPQLRLPARTGVSPEGGGWTLETRGKTNDGREFPAEISAAPWSSTQGDFLTAVVRDISERYRSEARIRQLNEELRKQVEQLAAANRELESFTYSVSHDLRAPLRAVDGFAGIIEEDYGARLDPEARRLLAVIRGNSRRMGQLIDDLLAFSRLGRAQVARTRVDMTALVAEVVAEMRAAGETGAAEFALAPLPACAGDGALLRQVWVNLLANALKFSQRRAAPRIEVGGRAERAENVYFVSDNGVGFDMAHAGQLFGVFQRLHRNDEFPGTGVGLAIVHRVIEKHGGRVWAEGRVDAGATFHFSLPRGNADA